eukprot:763388-Hanusia_phi.AAC.8
MTINSEWIKIWKTACPRCFTNEPRFQPTIYFIDGQIKLMKSEHINTWEKFLECQFGNVIRKAFRGGCSIVVLAFDNYEHVPASKGMTQAKRNKTKVEFEFNTYDKLPSRMPLNWNDAIRNRAFKSKVIDYVKTFLPGTINMTGNQRLVIDHQGPPTMYYPCQKYVVLEDIQPKGECDVKFTSYLHLGSMLIDAIDGDYIPMSMLYLENYKIENKKEPNQISIYRMECNNSKTAGEGGIEKCFKRKLVDLNDENEDPQNLKSLRAKKNYEHVYINQLYSELSKIIRQNFKDSQRPALTLASLAAMTGCDYTQGLPTIGPTRVWRLKQAIFPLLESHSERQLMHAFVKLYTNQYQKQLEKSEQVYTVQNSAEGGPVYDPFLTLKSSPHLAEKTKQLIPTVQYLASNARNIIWTLRYWEARDTYPNPMSSEYGYKRNPRNGMPEYCVNARGGEAETTPS